MPSSKLTKDLAEAIKDGYYVSARAVIELGGTGKLLFGKRAPYQSDAYKYQILGGKVEVVDKFVDENRHKNLTQIPSRTLGVLIKHVLDTAPMEAIQEGNIGIEQLTPEDYIENMPNPMGGKEIKEFYFNAKPKKIDYVSIMKPDGKEHTELKWIKIPEDIDKYDFNVETRQFLEKNYVKKEKKAA